MNPALRYNRLRNNRDIAPENRSGISRETSWTKHMEEARYLEVAKKVRGTLETVSYTHLTLPTTPYV